jgi:Family of unknown function (DUF6161)
MDQTFAISIARDSFRSSLLFQTPDDVFAFIDREQQLWNWIKDDDVRTSNGQINNLVARYRPDWTNQIRVLAQRWKDGDVSARDELANFLSRRFRSEGYLAADDSEAAAISALALTDRNVAAVALAVIQGIAPVADVNFMKNGDNSIGVAKGYAILAGIDPSVATGATTAFNTARADFEQDASQLRVTISELKQAALTAADQIAADARSQLERQSEGHSKIQTEHSQTFEKLKMDIEGVTAAYEHQMQLQGPVRYWKLRAKQHQTSASRALMILIPYCLIAIVCLYFLYDSAATHLPTIAEAVPLAALFKASAFAILMTTIVFWIGRVLLRIFLSERHLYTDAQERTTMIMTFLSLVRKQAVEDKDRELILGALFRAGSDGIVKEDASPDSAIATFLAALARK